MSNQPKKPMTNKGFLESLFKRGFGFLIDEPDEEEGQDETVPSVNADGKEVIDTEGKEVH